jgi:serine/threonine-protein kinase
MEPGLMVTTNLRLVRVLERGSMGSVWVADHLGLGTQVAVKFMSPTISQDPHLVARFTREARTAAQIKSVHVVQIFDHGFTPEGVPYIAMELLDGESLASKLLRGPVNLRYANLVLWQTSKALSKAHQLGIIHRDIKPANIFLTDSEGDLMVKLLDFGVAKHRDTLNVTKPDETVGTPAYMAPEQFRGAANVDYRADLWSLGVVTYHAVVGQVPFKAENYAALCLLIAKGVFPPPSTIRPELPPMLDGWFIRALSRDPAGRFQSAKEMAADFERMVWG